MDDQQHLLRGYCAQQTTNQVTQLMHDQRLTGLADSSAVLEMATEQARFTWSSGILLCRYW